MKSLSLKALFLFTASLPILSLAMEKPGNGQVIRKEIEGQATQNLEKKAKSDADLQKQLCIEGISQHIYNLDPTAISTYLTLDSCKTLNRDEKLKLYEFASQYANQINQFSQAGSQLTAKALDSNVKQRFAHQEDVITANKIRTILNVFVHLKNFKFPQAIFSPKPYQNSPRISLDNILESLIMAEQKGIFSCCSHLTLYNVAKTLVDKKKEGIAIEIITNQKQSDNNPILQPLKHLVSSGITLSAPKGNSFETNHHKFFIFKNNILNKSLVWMGSYNPTGHSNANSWDDVMILDDSDVIQDYVGRFNQIKSASKPITLQELQNTASNPSDWALGQNNVPKELWK